MAPVPQPRSATVQLSSNNPSSAMSARRPKSSRRMRSHCPAEGDKNGWDRLFRAAIAARVCPAGGAAPIFHTRSAPVSRELQMNFEKSLRRLDEIMAALETEQVGLNASLKLFEEGIQLLREASAELDKADTKVQLLIERSEGGFELRETDL